MTAENISSFDSSAPVASQAVTVTIDGKQATFIVTIRENPDADDISISPSIVIKVKERPGADNFDPNFSLTASIPMTVVLIVASYDQEGRLISASPATQPLEANKTADISASVQRIDGASYKFFIWEAGNVPLTAKTAFD